MGLPMAAGRLEVQQWCAAGHASCFPGPHHGLADGSSLVLRAERQDARSGAADRAPPGSRVQRCLSDLLPPFDQPSAVGLMQAVMHAIGDQIPVARSQTLQQKREGSEVDHRIPDRD